LATSGLAAVGAALLPDHGTAVFADPHAVMVARGQVRFVSEAVVRFSDTQNQRCPASLATLEREGYLLAAPIDPWGEPLLYGCVEAPRAFVVMSKGPDRQVGTEDDVMIAEP
jgi:hypothetical protein